MPKTKVSQCRKLSLLSFPDFLRLKCDRAVPACGNCVHREEVASCCYALRKTESSPRQQEALEMPTASQGRIDQLEQLVHMLMKERQHTQRPANSQTPRSDDGFTIQSSDHNMLEAGEPESIETGEEEIHHRVQDSARQSTLLDIKADYRQSRSIEEAHWALLLNEVSLCSF